MLDWLIIRYTIVVANQIYHSYIITLRSIEYSLGNLQAKKNNKQHLKGQIFVLLFHVKTGVVSLTNTYSGHPLTSWFSSDK